MQYMIKLTILFTLVVSCLSCQTVQVVTIKENETWTAQKKWKNYSREKFGGWPFFNWKYAIETSYPQFIGMKNQKFQDSLNQHLLEKYAISRNRRAYREQHFIPRYPYHHYNPDFTAYRDTSRQYTDWSRYELVFKSKRVISFRMIKGYYDNGMYGGNRPNGYFPNDYNIALKTGETLRMKSFFKGEAQRKALQKIFLEYLRSPEYDKVYKQFGVIPTHNLQFVISQKHYVFSFYYLDSDELIRIGIPKKKLRHLVHKKYRKL